MDRAPAPRRFRVTRISRALRVEDTPFRSTDVPQRDDLVIEWPMPLRDALGLAAFLVGMPVLAVVFSVAFSQPLVLATFGVSWLMIAYATAVYWVNRARIVVEGDEIRVERGPLPWFFPRRARARGVQHLVVRRTEPGGDGPRYVYELVATDDAGRPVVIVSMPTEPEARFLEQTIEDLLGTAAA